MVCKDCSGLFICGSGVDNLSVRETSGYLATIWDDGLIIYRVVELELLKIILILY